MRFLGTGTSSGVPMIGCGCPVCQSTDPRDKRLRSSIYIKSRNVSLVVDTGPDFRTQILREGITRLDAVLFTHSHKDHIAGLDDIRAFNFFSHRPMEVYADPLTEEAIRRDFYYAFSDRKYPGTPEINLHTLTGEPFRAGDLPVQPIKVWHLKLPVTSFRFGPLTYITDANRIEDAEKEKIRGTEVLIVNALRHEPHISHYSLAEAIALVRELKVPRAYFTHISHQLGLHETISETLPEGMFLAHDGLQLDFDLPLDV